MKNIEKAKVLADLKRYCKKHNINFTACGCCGGVHINCEDDEIFEGGDFLLEVDGDIKYYKKYQGKIFVQQWEDRFTKIEFIKDGNKIVNLGGRSHPFSKYMKRLNNEQLKEYFDYFI